MANTAEQLYQELQRSIFQGEMSGTSPEIKEQQELVKNVLAKTCAFLGNNKLIAPSNLEGLNTFQEGTAFSLENFNKNTSVANLGVSEMANFVREINVPRSLQATAIRTLGTLLAKFQACAGADKNFVSQHFSSTLDAADKANVQAHTAAVFAPSLYRDVTNIGIPSQESFGVNIDTVLPDIRSTITVAMLQYFRGLVDRIIHRRPTASPFVQYVQPYAEVYDLLKSNDATSEVRNHGDHIVPFIELNADPRVVSNVLQPIIPLMANDKNNALYSNGYLKINHKANLFDLSVLAESLGKSHHNYTDLVSDNVYIDSVLVTVTDNATGAAEIFNFEMRNENGARLHMMPNAQDSGIRSAVLTSTVKLGAESTTITGAQTTILAGCTATDFVRLQLQIVPTINLKTADAGFIGNPSFTAYNSSGTVDPAVATLVNGLKIELTACSLDARFSEENLRKSNLAIRAHRRPFYFEISNGRNIILDYSHQEDQPEEMMGLVGEATSLGQDHKAIDTTVKTLMHVYDVTKLENQDPNFRERLDKIGFQYIASQLVRPVVLINSIDLEQLNNLRDGDLTGDIRSKVEWALLNLFSVLSQNSFYRKQLNAGETPVFKCVTSNIILDNILSVPHYHNHLGKEEPVDGNNVEYRRVLSNGICLDVVTSTYNYLRDKMIIVPYREGAAEDVLNFAHNWDAGMFVSTYKYQNANAMNNRVFANSRTMVIPTNPIGMYLEVRNISKITDMYQLTNPTGSKLPQPSDIEARP